MTETTGPSDDTTTVRPPTPPTAPTPPTGAPTNFAAYGSAPTPPPLAPHHQPDAGRRRRPVRTIAGVVIAVLFIGLKLAIAVGAGHLLAGGSGPVVLVVVVVLILVGFVTRFMRL